jgi:hypothetical protein
MVKLALGPAALASAAMALTPACAAPAQDRTASPAGQATATPGSKDVTDSRTPINRRFPNLDAYLAYLEKQSRFDGAWYRQVRPGVYVLETGNLRLDGGAKPKRTFTREELEKKFGF